MQGRAGRLRISVAFGVSLVAALALVAAAFGRPDAASAPTAQAASERSAIRCGTTRTIGVAAPITGAAASLGQQQLKWARYYVTRYNRSHRTKLRIVSGD